MEEERMRFCARERIGDMQGSGCTWPPLAAPSLGTASTGGGVAAGFEAAASK